MPVGSLNYTQPTPPNYVTIPRASTSGQATHMSEGEAHRAMLAVGMLVTIQPGVPTVGGQAGLIVAVGQKAGDCTVLLKGWDHPLGFFWHEIVISKSPDPARQISILGYRVP